MATTTAYALSILTNYTNAEETTYAGVLLGEAATAGYLIYNTDLSLTRIWNGAAFVNAPIQLAAALPLVTTTAQGVVPMTGAPSGKFLKDDLTWSASAGSGDMVLASVQTVTGAKTFGTIGGAVGKFILAGSTSGSTILDASAVAGSGTVTLPQTGTLTGTEYYISCGGYV
jgi:hypothetical protein